MERFCKDCRHKRWFFNWCKLYAKTCRVARNDASLCGKQGHGFEISCKDCVRCILGRCLKYRDPLGYTMKCVDVRADEELCGCDGREHKKFTSLDC